MPVQRPAGEGSCCSRDSEETGKVECGGLGAEFDMGGPISWEQPGTNGTGSTWWQVVGTPVTHTETRRGSSKGEGGVMGKRRRHRIREEGATGRPTQIMNTVSKGVFHSPLGYFKSTNN